jgi:hypothetical protein
MGGVAMTAGRKPDQLSRTAGAWLVTRREDGTTSREALLTFNPFALPGHNDPDGPRDKARALAWQRERTRCRRAGLRGPVAREPRAGAGGARPPRLTSAEWRAFHALARARRAAAGAGAGRS